MIKLTKREIAGELRDRLEQKKKDLLELKASNATVPESLANYYKTSELKALLREETSDKCAYCESKMLHVSYGDVEHILPKSRRPELTFEYENLTLACSMCNTRKSDYYDPDLPLVNPYADDPAEHFVAAGPMLGRRPTSDRALLTEKKLDLNRIGLIEQRTDRLTSIAALLDQFSRTTNAQIRSVLHSQIQEECGPDKEFSFVVSGYVSIFMQPRVGERSV